MRSAFHRLTAALLALSLLLFPACGEKTPADTTPILTFAETNQRGNTNGNIANMGLAVRQGEWILFSDLADDAYLKATADGGRHCMKLMEDLDDTYACLNLIGQRLDYVSATYGDVNTLYLEENVAMPTWTGHTYCLQSVLGDLWFIDETGDGRIYRVNPETAETESVGTHPAYLEGVTDQTAHAAFSIDGGYLYYCAADDGSRVYRVRLSDGTEERLTQQSAAILIAEKGNVLFADADDGRLYRITAEGETLPMTSGGVTAFNTDGTTVWYVDASTGELMRCGVDGGFADKLCDAENAMYILLLEDVIMIYCADEEGTPATLFVNASTGETYSPGT